MNIGYHTTSCYALFLIKHIPLCHENCATVARPSLLRAGDAIHTSSAAEGSGLIHETSYPPRDQLLSRTYAQGVK